MKSAEYWIEQLSLTEHPEGGFFKETYRSSEYVRRDALPPRFPGERSFSTSIYFLLRSNDRSLFHRIKSDELWHYHSGSSLTLFVLHDSKMSIKKLGPEVDLGESLQVVIPASSWFGAKVNDKDSYTLSGCTVAPGFDFVDFELATRSALLKEFPSYESIIEELTKA